MVLVGAGPGTAPGCARVYETEDGADGVVIGGPKGFSLADVEVGVYFEAVVLVVEAVEMDARALMGEDVCTGMPAMTF